MGRSAHGRHVRVVQPCRVVTGVEGGASALVSVRDVAAQLGVHPETVRRLIRDGRLEAVRVGRVLRVRASALDVSLSRQRVKPLRSR